MTVERGDARPGSRDTPSLEKAVTAVAVTVKTVSAGAVIFRAGQRLGTGLVEVSVERNAKLRLTAWHDGYAPSNFVPAALNADVAATGPSRE